MKTMKMYADHAFSSPVTEINLHSLDAAVAACEGRMLVSDKVVNAHATRLPVPGLMRLGRGEPRAMTQSVFVRLLHLARVSWRDAIEEDASEALSYVEEAVHRRAGQLRMRQMRGVVHAALSDSHTPLTRLHVLKAAREALDLGTIRVTVFRGRLRVTGTTERVLLEPEEGDVLSGGWEILNDQFGHGARGELVSAMSHLHERCHNADRARSLYNVRLAPLNTHAELAKFSNETLLPPVRSPAGKNEFIPASQQLLRRVPRVNIEEIRERQPRRTADLNESDPFSDTSRLGDWGSRQPLLAR